MTAQVPTSQEQPTLSVIEAGAALGLGRSASYELAAAGAFPVAVIRCGRQYRVPTAALRRALQLDEPLAAR